MTASLSTLFRSSPKITRLERAVYVMAMWPHWYSLQSEPFSLKVLEPMNPHLLRLSSVENYNFEINAWKHWEISYCRCQAQLEDCKSSRPCLVCAVDHMTPVSLKCPSLIWRKKQSSSWKRDKLTITKGLKLSVSLGTVVCRPKLLEEASVAEIV